MAVTDPNAAPPAPPAPGIGATNQQNQGSTVAQAAAGQAKATEPQATIVAPDSKNKPQSNVPAQNTTKSAGDTTQQEKSPRQGTTAATTTAPAAPAPQFDNQPDPRTPEYYAHKAALDAQFNTQLLGLQSEQDAANLRFDQESMIQNEYQRQRRRNLAEARLGTGSAYTGSARRERAENDIDFAFEQARRNLDKTESDNRRTNQFQGIEADRSAAIADLDQQFVDRYVEGLMNEANTSAGDRQFDPSPYAPNYQKQIRGLTDQIKKLQSRLEGANPRQRARIKAKIGRLRKRRSKLQGKKNQNG